MRAFSSLLLGLLLFFMGWESGELDLCARVAMAGTTVPGITIQDGKISASLVETPISQVLHQLHQRLGIEVYVDPAIAHSTVTLDMPSLPLSEGFHELFKGYRYLLTWSFEPKRVKADTTLEGLQAIHVVAPLPVPKPIQLDKGPSSSLVRDKKNSSFTTLKNAYTKGLLGRGASVRDRPPKEQEDLTDIALDELRDLARNSPDSSIKLSALEELGERENVPDYLPLLASTLKDPDPGVRALTLELVKALDTIPVDLITDVAVNDPVSQLRIEAIDILGQTDAETFPFNSLGTIALHDKDPEIRIQSLELLEDYVAFTKTDKSAPEKFEAIVRQSLNDPVLDIREEAQDLLAEL